MTPEVPKVDVLKFGGTSVSGFEAFQQSCDRVKQHLEPGKGLVVVVSAMAGVTEKLREAHSFIMGRTYSAAAKNIVEIEKSHLSVLDQLGGSEGSEEARKIVTQVIQRLEGDFDAIYRIKSREPRARDILIYRGERLSSVIFGAFLTERNIPSIVLDAGEVVKTNDAFGDAFPDFALTTEAVRKLVTPELEKGKVVVMGGFYGTTASGDIATLGRGGSDLTATAMGRVLDNLGYNVLGVNLYKADVAGVMSAKPKIVKDAFMLSHLSRDEASAATMLGTSVIHPRAVHALSVQIPIFVRSTLPQPLLEYIHLPHEPYTTIDNEVYDRGYLPVKIITTLPDLKLVSLTGHSMDRAGIAVSFLEEFTNKGISFRSIGQPLTEAVISVVIPPEADVDPIMQDLKKKFEIIMRVGDIADIRTEPVSSVSIVGDGVGRPDVLEKFQNALAREGVVFNSNGGDSKSGEVLFVQPGKYDHSILVRGNDHVERAESIVRTLHGVLFEHYLK